jgi:hypothetical protein
MRRIAPLVLALALSAGTATASGFAKFVNGDAVASHMETYLNGKAKAKFQRNGGRNISRFLCAYDGYQVECYGNLTYQRIRMKMEITLEKRTAKRAYLEVVTTRVSNGEQLGIDDNILSPQDIGMRSF